MSIRIKRQISSKSLSKLAQSNTVTSLETLMLDLEEGFDTDDNEGMENISKNFKNECFIEYENVSRKIFLRDLFYSIIQFRFWILFTIIFSTIIFFVFIFSLVYYAASPQCGLHLHENGYKADSFLYAILIQFRTVLEPHPEFHTPFWNGCSAGVAGLFLQLFGGNVLMSILTSSLIFSFQSISRRGKSSKFSLITLSQSANISVRSDSSNSATRQVADYFFKIFACDTNMSSTLKIDRCTATVYVFSPPDDSSDDPSRSSAHPMICLAARQPLMISTPGQVEIEILKKFILPKNHPSVIFETGRKSCQVCGKPIVNFNTYLKHLRASDDTEHDIEYENYVEQLDRFNNIPNSPAVVIQKILQRGLQFIVIVEGSDPITGDRIQVQKIYTPNLLVAETEEQNRLVSFSESKEAAIEYTLFL